MPAAILDSHVTRAARRTWANAPNSEATPPQRLDGEPLSRHTLTTIEGRGRSISTEQEIDARGLISAASLLFAPGERPARRAIAALARDKAGFAVSLDPAEEGDGDSGPGEVTTWLELLANGLTFDLIGLAPGQSAELPAADQLFGLPETLRAERLEAVALRPGPHLAAGAGMLPVVRSLAWLAARLADLPGVRAVAWHPARCWSAPAHFRDLVLRWSEGGVFPGLGLASLSPMPDGGMQSHGLALFGGQELRLEPQLAQDRAAGAKIALRLMHWLVEHGRLEAEERLTGPDGQPLRLEPSPNGRFVRVWRG